MSPIPLYKPPTHPLPQHSEPAIVQAVAKSILKIPSRNSDKCLLREADSDQYHKAQEEKRAKEREERAEAKKQRHADYLQREKARQDAMAARKAAEREAHGQVGYAVERGVTKIGRNYM